MIGFLKSFFANEKTAEEQALLQNPRDVISLDAYAMDEAEEESPSACGGGGCGGCGCR